MRESRIRNMIIEKFIEKETLWKFLPINREIKMNAKIIVMGFLFTTFLFAAEGYKGFGLQVGEQGTGIFYHQSWRSNDAMQWVFHGRIFDVKGDDQMMVYDYYTGQTRSVGDKYVYILPMFGGAKYFPFYDSIANNFTPFATAQLGPVLTIDGADSEKFATRWGKSKGLWTIGGYVGVGVDFLMANGMIVSVGAGMDFLPMNGKVKDESNYNGAIIHFAFNWLR
ncbi:MAG: hypothetical protein IIB95_07000 [Candidatus Marinimicrobia bacterium]|nr:hypothetical protein [Candidatus Neomarinimicrobiota bacterium]MCH7763476.1 hypothetical protein [Candidatus Neomarinimicrobiota bacterium]